MDQLIFTDISDEFAASSEIPKLHFLGYLNTDDGVSKPFKSIGNNQQFHATRHPPKNRFFIKITVGNSNFATLNLRYVTLCCWSLELVLSEYTSSLNWLLCSFILSLATVRFSGLLCNLERFALCDCQGYDLYRSALSRKYGYRSYNHFPIGICILLDPYHKISISYPH